MIEIMRHKSRRLYNRTRHCYTTLEAVEALAIHHDAFSVLCESTGADITTYTACQILLKRLETGRTPAIVKRLLALLHFPPPEKTLVEITRYHTNRRLYDHSESRYCALADVEALWVGGTAVRVTLHPNNTDVTSEVLCRILLKRMLAGTAHPSLEQVLALY